MEKFSKIVLVLCAIFVIGTVAYRFYDNEKFAKIEIEKKLIDIGERKPTENIEVVYKIENIGDMDFSIADVQADCHCTVPEWTKSPVKKGEYAEIHVNYNNKNLGYFQQNITVSCNVEHSPIILILRGKTIPNQNLEIQH